MTVEVEYRVRTRKGGGFRVFVRLQDAVQRMTADHELQVRSVVKGPWTTLNVPGAADQKASDETDASTGARQYSDTTSGIVNKLKLRCPYCESLNWALDSHVDLTRGYADCATCERDFLVDMSPEGTAVRTVKMEDRPRVRSEYEIPTGGEAARTAAERAPKPWRQSEYVTVHRQLLHSVLTETIHGHSKPGMWDEKEGHGEGKPCWECHIRHLLLAALGLVDPKYPWIDGPWTDGIGQLRTFFPPAWYDGGN